MSLEKAANRSGFNRGAVDAVEGAFGLVIDPVPPEKKTDAIKPGTESGLRRGKTRAKRLPERKLKRTPFL